MMDIPVNNQNVVQSVDIARMMSSNDSVIENTKPHRPVAHSMMIRRTKQSITIPDLPLHHSADCIHRPTSCVQSRHKRTGAQDRLIIDLAPGSLERAAERAMLSQRAYTSDIITGMIHSNFVFRSLARGNRQHKGSEARTIEKFFCSLCNKDRRGMRLWG